MINMQAIQSASVEQYPWHHLSIDNVLEDYEQVIDHWPAVKLMKSPADTGFPNRHNLHLTATTPTLSASLPLVRSFPEYIYPDYCLDLGKQAGNRIQLVADRLLPYSPHALESLH